jgi:hypothetical protein
MIKIIRFLIFLTCGLAFSQAVPTTITTTPKAQEEAPKIPEIVKNSSIGHFGPLKVLVKLDPYSRIPEGDIPQDRNFYIRMYFNSGDTPPTKIYVVDKDHALDYDFPVLVIKKDILIADEDKNLKLFDAIDFLMPPLKPNHRYSIVLIFPNSDSETSNYIKVLYEIYKNEANAETFYNSFKFEENSGYTKYTILKKFYEEKNIKNIFEKSKTALKGNPTDTKIIENATNDIKLVIYTNNFITISPKSTQTVFLNAKLILPDLLAQPYKIESSAPLTLIADAGMIYAGFQKDFSVITPYVGICISLRAYDSDIKFREVKMQGLRTWERLSFHIGLTLNSFAKDNYRDDIYGTNNIMAGLSYRFSNVICLTGGTVFYNNLDPNPLIDKKTLGVAPYIGISINLKIKAAFGEIGKVFGYGK